MTKTKIITGKVGAARVSTIDEVLRKRGKSKPAAELVGELREFTFDCSEKSICGTTSP